MLKWASHCADHTADSLSENTEQLISKDTTVCFSIFFVSIWADSHYKTMFSQTIKTQDITWWNWRECLWVHCLNHTNLFSALCFLSHGSSTLLFLSGNLKTVAQFSDSTASFSLYSVAQGCYHYTYFSFNTLPKSHFLWLIITLPNRIACSQEVDPKSGVRCFFPEIWPCKQ